MRIALISDVHGNLVALEAVAVALAADRPDRIVCLGDVAASGPRPAECIERAASLATDHVMGNSDAWLIASSPQPALSRDPRIERIHRWNRRRLRERHRTAIASARSRVEIQTPAGLVCCFHGSPRSLEEPIHAHTPPGALDDILEGVAGSVVAAGHTHQAMVRRHRDRLIVNPGSVGMPLEFLEDGRVRYPAWAEYAILDLSAPTAAVSLHRAPVARAEVVADAEASGMPSLAFWRRGWEA